MLPLGLVAVGYAQVELELALGQLAAHCARLLLHELANVALDLLRCCGWQALDALGLARVDVLDEAVVVGVQLGLFGLSLELHVRLDAPKVVEHEIEAAAAAAAGAAKMRELARHGVEHLLGLLMRLAVVHRQQVRHEYVARKAVLVARHQVYFGAKAALDHRLLVERYEHLLDVLGTRACTARH